MTCRPEINRRYGTRHDAWDYLVGRGFACAPDGWRNGRWHATIDHDPHGFSVKVWLPVPGVA